MERIRTVLVEDQDIVRVGIRTILEASGKFEIVGEFTDGEQAVEHVVALHPTVVLMDIGLPTLDGIKATTLIKQLIEVKIIIITSHDDERDVSAALAAGADGYFLKGLSPQQLKNAIHCVMDGGVWLGLHSWRQRGSQIESALTGRPLSDRELQVLALLAEGFSNQEIAETLKLGNETIKTHMRHLMAKLGVSDRTQAAVKAVSKGLIRPGSGISAVLKTD